MCYFTIIGTDGCKFHLTYAHILTCTNWGYRSHEAENLNMRYRKFDLDHLLDAAVQAVEGEARSCKQVVSVVTGEAGCR